MATENHTFGEQGAPVHELKVPKTDEELVAFVQKTHDYLQPFKRGLERHWNEAILFLLGEQWIRYDALSNRFSTHSLDSYVPTPVTNYLVKPYDRIVDLLTSPDYRPTGLPATDDLSDVDAGQIATRVMRHIYEELQTGGLHLSLAEWLVLTGNCFGYVNWDPNAGVLEKVPKQKLIKTPVTEEVASCPTCGADSFPQAVGQTCPSCNRGIIQLEDRETGEFDSRREQVKDKTGKKVYNEIQRGQVVEAAANPFNMYLQPRNDFKKVAYVVEVIPFDLDELISTFGSVAKTVQSEDLEIDRRAGFGTSSRYLGRATEPRRSMVRVKYLRHLPQDVVDDDGDRKFPDGKYIIEANGVLLHDGPLDTVSGKLPYHMSAYRKIVGEMWGVGPFQDAIPLQKRINSIDSHIILNRKLMNSPQWLAPQGSGVSQIDGRPGLIIRYNPHNTGGMAPMKVPGIGLPGDVIQERAQAVADIEEIFGTAEVLTGQAPEGVEAGVSLNLLSEQALRRFGPMVKRWLLMLKSLEKDKLLIASKEWDESRLIRVVGGEEDVATFNYRGADFSTVTDVSIGMTKGGLLTESAKRQMLLMAAQNGFLGDIGDPKVKGRLLEKLEIEGFDSEYTLDAKKARRVLQSIRQGREPPSVTPFDEHAIQLQTMVDFIKTSEFEEMEEAMQRQIKERAQIHQQFLQQAQQEQMQLAEAAKGTSAGVSDAIIGAQDAQGEEAPQRSAP
jgi:hypothetical protein